MRPYDPGDYTPSDAELESLERHNANNPDLLFLIQGQNAFIAEVLPSTATTSQPPRSGCDAGPERNT